MANALPTFLMIGPGRSATTWMYEVLREHPEVCTPKGTRDSLYFERNFERGFEWYQGFFADCQGMPAVGEVGNSYIFFPEAAGRIREALPDVQLITSLRNPLERIESVYLYRKRRGRVEEDFASTLRANPDMITDNFYHTHLQRFLALFPREQLTVLFYDDLKADPERFARSLFEAVGVDPDFRPSVLTERVNNAAEVRSSWSGMLSNGMADLLRRLDMIRLLEYLKGNRLVRRLLLKPCRSGGRKVMSQELRAELRELFRPEIEQLAELTNRDLGHWLEV